MSCPRPNDRPLDPRSWGDLHKTLRDKLWTARIDAAAVGLLLWLNSGGRADSQQWDLRHARCRGRECDPSCKGVPTTARPGRSNHRNLSEQISAADMAGTGLPFLHTHQRAYGIDFPVPNEPWHAENNGQPTVEIIEWPAMSRNTTPPPPPPPPPLPHRYEDDEMLSPEAMKQVRQAIDDGLEQALGPKSKLDVAAKVRSIFRHNVEGVEPSKEDADRGDLTYPQRVVAALRRIEAKAAE